MILGRNACGTWSGAADYEWLATNGIGGFSCGTVAGGNTRRYHGFLVASLNPPVERTLLVAKVESALRYRGRDIDLSSNEFVGGAISGEGFIHLESFRLIEGIPTWRYALDDVLLEQQIFMAHESNTTYLRLEALRASDSVSVLLKPLMTCRDYHAHSRGAQPFQLQPMGSDGAAIQFDHGPACRLRLEGGSFRPAPLWYWNFWHRIEASRGLDTVEDLLSPGTFEIGLEVGSPAFFTATIEPSAPPHGVAVLGSLSEKSKRLTARLPRRAPVWIADLARAADQFIVRRGPSATDAVPAASSIIAGYPWFTDWGRDTMISLPGLATCLGRHELAAQILRTYCGFIDGGMLPNCFPDAAAPPRYNTADATLWMFHALEEHLAATRDTALARELFPALMNVIRAHAQGTRYGIGVDPNDGLLRAGESGTQLTWMDAKHGDEVFTPRIGKPVEINALWLNALHVAARIAGRLRQAADQRFCLELLTRANAGFARFWNEAEQCLHDVIDVDGGSACDSRIRPNQIIAVCLPHSVLSAQQMRCVVDRCARDLLTSHGLRTLCPQDPGYIGRYQGDAHSRDAAYHMGTAWTWLLGPFARAHFRAHGDARCAQGFLEPLAQHLNAVCMGSLGEIFDGDAPHNARGCFAQAWSVAEILRSWIHLERKISTR